MKYIIICSFCGNILMKSNEVILGTLDIETRCPNQNCKKFIKMPKDIKIILTKERKPKGFFILEQTRTVITRKPKSS